MTVVWVFAKICRYLPNNEAPAIQCRFLVTSFPSSWGTLAIIAKKWPSSTREHKARTTPGFGRHNLEKYLSKYWPHDTCSVCGRPTHSNGQTHEVVMIEEIQADGSRVKRGVCSKCGGGSSPSLGYGGGSGSPGGGHYGGGGGKGVNGGGGGSSCSTCGGAGGSYSQSSATSSASSSSKS
uniref:Uncharacterized protein n=1 Tax=Timema genevievae TaxID=629358 RepID=A0A7R9PSH7_TIMGE|nr:unnamed protein product [Timema genevievae]